MASKNSSSKILMVGIILLGMYLFLKLIPILIGAIAIFTIYSFIKIKYKQATKSKKDSVGTNNSNNNSNEYKTNNLNGKVIDVDYEEINKK